MGLGLIISGACLIFVFVLFIYALLKASSRTEEDEEYTRRLNEMCNTKEDKNE